MSKEIKYVRRYESDTTSGKGYYVMYPEGYTVCTSTLKPKFKKGDEVFKNGYKFTIFDVSVIVNNIRYKLDSDWAGIAPWYDEDSLTSSEKTESVLKCECGSEHQSVENHHLTWCPKYLK